MTHISGYKWSSVKPYWPFHWWEQWEYIPLSHRNRPQAAVHKFTVYKLYHGFFALWLEEGSQKTPPFGLHVCYRSLHLLYAAAGGWTRDPSVIRTASRPTLNPLQGPRCSTFKSHSQERTREREREGVKGFWRKRDKVWESDIRRKLMEGERERERVDKLAKVKSLTSKAVPPDHRLLTSFMGGWINRLVRFKLYCRQNARHLFYCCFPPFLLRFFFPFSC